APGLLVTVPATPPGPLPFPHVLHARGGTARAVRARRPHRLLPGGIIGMPIETRVHGAAGTVSQTAADLGAEAMAVPVRTGPVAPAAEAAAGLPFTLDELLELHEAKGEPGEITATQ